MRNSSLIILRITVLLLVFTLFFGLTMEARAGGGATATPVPAEPQKPAGSGNPTYPEPVQPTAEPAPEQLPGLTMRARPAYAGNFKYGDWLPIWVELENQGADIEAEIRVRVADQRGAVTYAAPALLPSGSRKRIPLYVLPNAFSHELNVELVSGEKVLAFQKFTVSGQANINYLVGLMSPERGTLSLISAFRVSGQDRPVVLFDVSPQDLPERAEGLRSLDTLVIDNTDTSSLAPEQQAALGSWVRMGGRLIIGGGANAARTLSGLPKTLLPFTFEGLTEVDELPGLVEYGWNQPIRVPGPFVVATGKAEGGKILAEQDDLPVVWEWTVDGGFVDFIALDLTASPFDAWGGTPGFWSELLTPGARYPVEWMPVDISMRQMRANNLIYSLSNLPTLDLPSIKGLAVLLVIYVLLIGPVNYLVLRWRKRLHLAWLTIPLLTLAFSGGAFGLGYAMRGNDLILNKIAIIEARPDGSANLSSYMGLFSPERRSYEIEVRGEGLLSPMNQEYDPWSGMPVTSIGDTTFMQGDPARVVGLSVNQWSMQSFMTEGEWRDFGNVAADLQFEGETLEGTVTNQTRRTISGAALVLGSRIEKLGDLAPGETKEVSMNVPSLMDNPFGASIGYQLFSEYFDQPSPTGPPRDIQMKQNILDNLFQWGSWYGPMFNAKMPNLDTANLSRLILLGWLNQAPPEVRVAGREPATQTTALLIQQLPYQLTSGDHLSLPPGFIPGSVIEINDGGYCGPMGAPTVYLGQQEAVFEFSIPSNLPSFQSFTSSTFQLSDIESLILHLGSDGGWSQAPSVALYDWDTEDWSGLSKAVMGRNIINDPENLVDAAGKVRVRLMMEDFNQGGGCFYLAMGLEGKK